MEHSTAGFQNSRYRSTLTVTGRLPGMYQYSVTNRATSDMVTTTFTIESKNSTNYISLQVYKLLIQSVPSMGDSRICSRGFPGSFVVHGALVRLKFSLLPRPLSY